MQYIGRTQKKKQSPIMKEKRLYKPKPHHERAIQNVIKNKFFGLLLAPGRGKTGIILEAFRRLKSADEVDVLIVVAKLRITKQTWPRELRKWGFSYEHHIAHGNKKQLEGHDVIFTNYESLRWIESELKRTRLYKKKRIMMVLDESTKIKNTNTIRFKVIRRIAPLFDRRYILTGSPAPNGLKDIFGQIFFLDLGKSLGKYITHFLAMHFFIVTHKTKKGQEYQEYELMPGMEEEIYNKIDHVVMRLGESDKLPALTKVNRMIELEGKERFAYDELEEELITELEDGVVTAANAGVKSMKLRQMASGYVYGENHNVICVHEAKIDELEEIYEELQGSPCIVSYEFNHERDAILKHFPDAVYFAGGDEGIEIEARWNRGEIPMLLGQTSAIAHGLNLQESGHTLIMFTTTWNLEDYEQIIKRLHREGQKNPVMVIHLMIENSVDEAVLMAINTKDRTQRALLDALELRYLKRELMADEKIVKIFTDSLKTFEYKNDEGKTVQRLMPNYCPKDGGDSFVKHLLFILDGMGHNRLQDFIFDSTGKEPKKPNELVELYEESLTILTKAFDIEEISPGKFMAYKDKLIRKYCNKVVKSVSAVDKTPEYLSLRKKSTSGNKEESKMATKKSVAKKGKGFNKKSTVKKPANKEAAKKPANKEAVKKAATKKPVAKKINQEKPIKIVAGNKELAKRDGIMKDIANAAGKGPMSMEKFVAKVMKASDAKQAKDEKLVIYYVKQSIKKGSIKVA